MISSPQEREKLLAFGQRESGVRTVLIGESGRTFGPQDIVDWLTSVAPAQLPWRDFSINQAA